MEKTIYKLMEYKYNLDEKFKKGKYCYYGNGAEKNLGKEAKLFKECAEQVSSNA